jgi:hypothetical protein
MRSRLVCAAALPVDLPLGALTRRGA